MNWKFLNLAIVFNDDVNSALGTSERSKGELDHGWPAIVSASKALIDWQSRTFKLN